MQRFVVTEFADPFFIGALLPLAEEYVRQTGLNDEMSAADYIRELGSSLVQKAPVKIFVVVDKKTDRFVAMVVLVYSSLPPRVWVDCIVQLREYAKWRPAKLAWQEAEKWLQENNIRRVYCLTAKAGLARLFAKEAGFYPHEIVMRKVIPYGRQQEKK